MNKLFENKNLLLSLISVVILIAAIIISSIAISTGKKNKEAEISESIRISRMEELSSLAELLIIALVITKLLPKTTRSV